MYAAFRNLYKIWSNDKVVAFVTAGKDEEAMKKYVDNGGKMSDATAEKVSFGYPHDVCSVYK